MLFNYQSLHKVRKKIYAVGAFMYSLFNKAGIDELQLTLALEPEAASIYCQRESLEKLRINQKQSKLTNPKTRYLVADIGGICHLLNVYLIWLRIKTYEYPLNKRVINESIINYTEFCKPAHYFSRTDK